MRVGVEGRGLWPILLARSRLGEGDSFAKPRVDLAILVSGFRRPIPVLGFEGAGEQGAGWGLFGSAASVMLGRVVTSESVSLGCIWRSKLSHMSEAMSLMLTTVVSALAIV